MEFKELEDTLKQMGDNREKIGRMRALTELEEKIKDESVQKQIVLDGGMVFSGKVINTHALLSIIKKMREDACV